MSQNVIKANKKMLKNHNGLFLGQSGSGKSVFAKSEILSTFLNFLDDQIIIVAPQNEYSEIAAVADGTVISFDSTKEFYINPMDVNFSGVDYGRLREIISDKADFILTLLFSFHLVISGNDFNELHPLNIELILVTFFIFHLEISGNALKELHP